MSDLLYAKERRFYNQMRTAAILMGRWEVVRACESVIDFIDKHSPRLDGDQEDQ